MKTTIAKTVRAYRALNDAKLNKMEAGEQIALVKALRPIRTVAEEYDSFLKESVKKLAPEGWEETQQLLATVDSLSGDELKAKLADPKVAEAVKTRIEYNDKVLTLDREEAAKETDLDFTALSDEALGRLFAGNEFTASQCMEIADILGATETDTPKAE